MIGRTSNMYVASEKRYDSMTYNRLGTSGLKLPATSVRLGDGIGLGAARRYRDQRAGRSLQTGTDLR